MRHLFVFFLLPFLSVAQFAPPAGQAGTTAMYKDSSAFIHWANSCRVTRGLEDISNSSSGYPTIGDSSSATGIADNSIVSLGDGGYAICTFQYPIMDGPGADFAVFENSFSDDYLEFGFVEVSSDGVNFFRFPATCNIEDTVQTGSFGTCDASLVNNLAGKYRALYGTPFDLQELAGTTGLDINNITHVKVIDVVGSVSTAYATFDKNNHKVNDPWPTAFASSGFDLDAVGVIHDITNDIAELENASLIVYPNPASDHAWIQIKSTQSLTGFSLTNLRGESIAAVIETSSCGMRMKTDGLSPGVYFIRVTFANCSLIEKLIISE